MPRESDRLGSWGIPDFPRYAGSSTSDDILGARRVLRVVAHRDDAADAVIGGDAAAGFAYVNTEAATWLAKIAGPKYAC